MSSQDEDLILPGSTPGVEALDVFRVGSPAVVLDATRLECVTLLRGGTPSIVGGTRVIITGIIEDSVIVATGFAWGRLPIAAIGLDLQSNIGRSLLACEVAPMSEGHNDGASITFHPSGYRLHGDGRVDRLPSIFQIWLSGGESAGWTTEDVPGLAALDAASRELLLDGSRRVCAQALRLVALHECARLATR